jgi:NHL repeat-containing protein
VRRHAKASSAGSNLGQGTRLASIRRAFAIGDASSGSDGRETLPHRRRNGIALLGLAALLTLLVGVAIALASKRVDSFAGSPTGATGTTGGLLNVPRGIAVNQAGTGGSSAGDYYVADSANNRIEQFRANNTFVRAFGQDVVSSGPDNASEVQWVTVDAAEGAFKLTFGAETTTDLPFNATAVEVQNALNALLAINTGSGSVAVSGGPGDGTGSKPYVVTFNGGPLKGTDVGQITAANGATPLGGGSGFGANEAIVTTANPGATGYEVCDALANPTDICKAGASGGLGGAMASPQGVAIDQSTGSLYVTDPSNGRIQRFSATGAWISAFGWDTITNGAASGDASNVVTFQICAAMQNCKSGVTGDSAGQFSEETGEPAVAPGGSLFVADAGNRRVEKFDSSGNFITTWGWDVVPTGKPGNTGTGLEFCPAEAASKPPAEKSCQAGSSGSGAGQFGPGSSPTRVAADSTGKVYVVDGGNKRIQTFDSSGGTPATFFAATGPEVAPTDVAIGPANSVFVVHPCPNQIEGLEAVCPGLAQNERRIKEFNSAGVLQSTSLEGAGFTVINGLAAATSGDKVYFSTSGGSAGSRVWALDNNGNTPAPVVTIAPPTEITAHTASFSGTVNPNGPIGLPTSYHFEYSTNGVKWIPVAADVNLGEGSSPINVPLTAAQGSATGLQADTFYRVRIVANKAFGAATGISPELTFLTDAIGPEVQTFYPQDRTDTTARFFGQLNANNLFTTYRFEYGKTTSYGSSAPVPDGTASDGDAHSIFQNVSGLEPSTNYHYRLVATNAEGTTKGEDVTFTTRTAGATDIPNRSYEMVTPPFKATRATGRAGGSPSRNADVGLASLDGNRLMLGNLAFPIGQDQVFPFDGDRAEFHRTAKGWIRESQLTKGPLPGSVPNLSSSTAQTTALSGDFTAQSWIFGLPILENASPQNSLLYTRRDGTGTNGFSNWPSNVEATTTPYGLSAPETDSARFNDDGSWMVRWGKYRGLLGATAVEDPSVTQLSGNQGGQTIYLEGAPPTGSLDLVNGCTGTGAEATQIPTRTGTGVSTDTIGTRNCEQGSVTSVRGATVGAGGLEFTGAKPLRGIAATAMSNDGRRVFFASPDGEATSVPTSCSTGAGAATNCPPQLFLRQYDSNHENPGVRWISHSRSHSVGENGYDGAMIAGQQIGLFGRGAAFEGASRNGDIVYFRTNAPLTPDDPNGAGVTPPAGGVKTGNASTNSWDLYQYKLSSSGDPANGTLTRISGGPAGTADPDTNRSQGDGAVARYISDDGKRAYFLTTSPIAGADATPPLGGITTPGGTLGNEAVRDLYLFDENASGAARFKFIAQIPFSVTPAVFPTCASYRAITGQDLFVQGFSARGNAILPAANKCFRGTSNGAVVIFETPARLTADDTDNASDIYLYDARTDDLTRISAPPPGVSGYGCKELLNPEKTVVESCNGDLGFGGYAVGEKYDSELGWSGGRHYNIGEDAEGRVSVFFQSRSPLVSEDTNGNHWDTYQWQEGTLSLVSPGYASADAYYSGNGLDGRDVFFQTSQRIDPREVDAADEDIYDARVGGGIPYVPPATPCDVLALQCEGNASPPPANATSATREFSGPGNPGKGASKPRCAKGKVRRHGRCTKQHKRQNQHERQNRRAARTMQRSGK